MLTEKEKDQQTLYAIRDGVLSANEGIQSDELYYFLNNELYCDVNRKDPLDKETQVWIKKYEDTHWFRSVLTDYGFKW